MAALKQTILIVEDESLTAVSESIMLVRNGYRVICASSGEEALGIVRERDDVDMVLMDIELGPGMDGTEAAERILSIRNLPVLFLSNHTGMDIVQRAEKISSYGYVVKYSGETVLLASIRMAFRLFDAYTRLTEKERAIRESQERNQRMLDYAPVGIYERDIPSGKFLNVNDRMCEFTGYSREELLSLDMSDLLTEASYRDLMQRNRRVMAGEPVPDEPEYEIRLKDKSTRWVVFIGRYIYGATGSVTGATVVFYDITERKRKALWIEQVNRIMLDRAIDPIFLFNRDGEYRYVNRAFTEGVGRSSADIIGKKIWDIFPGAEGDLRFSMLQRVYETGEPGDIEARVPRPGGDRHYITTYSPIPGEDGETQAVICTSKEITEINKARSALKSSLEEKQTLFRELQHRFKNNLSMITSLVSLQRNSVMTDEARDVLENLQGRIESIAHLYAILYNSDGDTVVFLDEYIETVVRSISRTFVAGLGAVTVKTELDRIPVDMKRASSYGLIVNELLTNALKYAFPDGKDGSIWIQCVERDGAITLSVSDDGIGLPEGFMIDKSRGFGMFLLKIMSQQLGGSYRCEGGEKTVFAVDVPLKNPQAMLSPSGQSGHMREN
ncbi:MAG: PAS domain S-box protein [Spirochaetes bacterium]|nr:PAS domain S-box protein [Spirochaetota bacterium]